MSTALVCSRCGLANPVGATFCARCAERLTSTSQAQAVPGTQVSPPQAWYEWKASQVSHVERQGIERTETGLLLLIIGILLAPIPYANYVGGILAVVGAIMVILGREVFGQRHSRFVISSLVIYLAGLAVAFVNTIGLAFSLFSVGFGTPTSAGQVISDAFNQFLVGVIAAAAVSGIAVLLFTYALQNPTGRILLWAGYAASLATSVLIFYIVGAEVTSAVQQGISSTPPNFTALLALQGQIQLLSLLGLIPAMINATAYYLVWSRIKSGELPETPGQANLTVPSPGLRTMVAR